MINNKVKACQFDDFSTYVQLAHNKCNKILFNGLLNSLINVLFPIIKQKIGFFLKAKALNHDVLPIYMRIIYSGLCALSDFVVVVKYALLIKVQNIQLLLYLGLRATELAVYFNNVVTCHPFDHLYAVDRKCFWLAYLS